MKYSNIMFRMIGVLACPLLLLTACDDKQTDKGPEGVAVTISSDIVSMTGAAADNGWKANDAIGLFMVKTGKGIVVNMASNQKFVTPGDGVFNAAQGAVMFPVSGEKVDFFAYAPYRDLVYDFIFPISLADQRAAPVLPFMYADRVRDKEASAPQVKFSFKHQLSKLILKVSAGSGLPNLDNLSIRIKGLPAEADFDLLEGTLAVKASTAEILPTHGTGNTYYALLLPTGTALTPAQVVDFVTPGNTYTWTMADDISRIEPAKIYEFDITVARAGIHVSGTITDWVDTDWEDVSAGNN